MGFAAFEAAVGAIVGVVEPIMEIDAGEVFASGKRISRGLRTLVYQHSSNTTNELRQARSCSVALGLINVGKLAMSTEIAQRSVCYTDLSALHCF